MKDIPTFEPETSARKPARDWVQTLAQYREPCHWRSLFELFVSVTPFCVLWALAWWALSVHPMLAFAIATVNALFLVRIFVIQHDCGHGSFFTNRTLSDWVGRALGVLTLTPYDVWRRCHAIHHSASGNLDKRGIGDIMTLTIDEYRARSAFGRLQYRIYRNPIFLFAFVPVYLYLFQNRLPIGLMTAGWRYWISAMGTNAVLAVALGLIFYTGGLMPLLVIFLPTTIIAASIGVWLFYVQHQFEDTQWDENDDWLMHDAALHGSSHYDLPAVLRWFSANIGVHHVHHLYARIPFYRLSEVLRDHAILADYQRLTLLESLRCVRLNLWDPKNRRLVSFSEAKSA